MKCGLISINWFIIDNDRLLELYFYVYFYCYVDVIYIFFKKIYIKVWYWNCVEFGEGNELKWKKNKLCKECNYDWKW